MATSHYCEREPVEGQIVSYISVSLHRYAVRKKQALRRHAQREVLALNASKPDQQGDSIQAIETGLAAPSAEEEYFLLAPLEQQISDRALHAAFLELTWLQKRALFGLVIEELPQRLLARSLLISQQAVSRSKNRALLHLRTARSEGVKEWKTS